MLGAFIALVSAIEVLEDKKRHSGESEPKVDVRRLVGTSGRMGSPTHRNDPCPCGSGKKFKVCGRGGKCVKTASKESEVDSSRE
jgi:uncharacterized protein YecA (UPF0149 family)